MLRQHSERRLAALLILVFPYSCSRNHPSREIISSSAKHISTPSSGWNFSDAVGDGTPGFLRLDQRSDREKFIRWFTFLAEVEYVVSSQQRSPEITDCSALLRYCYREALRRHDSAWAAEAKLPLVPAFASVAKYNYPRTPLGPRLFRLRPGPFEMGNLADESFGEFADAHTLQRFNTTFISRDVYRAIPGDLLFFKRRDSSTFHSMIFLGKSKIDGTLGPWVVYNTGPEGQNAGVMRRLKLTELLHFPDPQWWPVSVNSQFLGVYRWNILASY